MSGWRVTGRDAINGRGLLNGTPLNAHPARGREPVAVLPLRLPDNVVPIQRAHVIRARRQFGSFDGRVA